MNFNINSVLILAIIILFAVKPSAIPAQSIYNRIDSLKYMDETVLPDSIRKICWDIYLREPDVSNGYVEYLLSTTERINPEAYLNALAFSATYMDSGKIRMLDTIYYLAKNENLLRIMAWTYEAKSEYYKNHEKYDSAMVSILRARDLYEEGNYIDDLVTVMHTTGDLYYAAGEYNEAEKIYRRIQQMKGAPDQWERWRKRTIRNNLGLIEIKRGNYEKARELFHISLREVTQRNSGIIDSVAIAYIYSRLSDIYFRMNDYDNALKSYIPGLKTALNCNQYEFAANLYLTRSKIFYYSEQLDSALHYAKLSESLSQNKFNSLSFNTEITSFIAKIYEKLRDDKNQLLYIKKSSVLKDSLVQKQNNWKYLRLLAEYEYDALNRKLSMEKSLNRNLIFGFIILVFVLTIILVLFLRLHRTNLYLVSKNLEAESAKKRKDKQIIIENDPAKEPDNEEFSQLNILVEALEEKMKSEKLYLQKDLTILKVAELLSTNRTYLSRAVNNILKISFTAYTNRLRIQEAISKISSGFFDDYTIEGIAAHCGFNSRSSFIRAFTDYTGVAPSFFIKHGSKNKKE